MPDDEQPPTSKGAPVLRSIVAWLTFVAVILIGLAFPYFIFNGFNPEYGPLYKEHFQAIIGLPLAAVASLFLVFVLEQASGPIEFEGLGFTFKGASGPLVFWVLIYLSITASLKALW